MTQNSSGGSSDPFKIEQTPVQVEPVIEEPVEGEEGEAVEESATDAIVSGMMVEASVKMLGKTLELLTKMQEMNFDEDEVEQLKMAWSPLMPSVSPMTAAIIITTTIVAGKVAIYAGLHNKKREIEPPKLETKKDLTTPFADTP